MAEDKIPLQSEGEKVVEKASEKVTEVILSIQSQTASMAELVAEKIDALDFISDRWVPPVTLLCLLTLLGIGCWTTFAIFRPVILRLVRGAAYRSPDRWDSHFVGHGLFRWLTHLLPAFLIRSTSPGLFEDWPTLASFLVTFARVYTIVAAFFAFSAFLDGVRSAYRSSRIASKFEIESFIQVLKLVATLIAILLLIAILIGKSPLYLLGGVGVFASVLVLVFKDILLGFVAGIQLASNKMLSPGDWVEIPDHLANGTVEEVGLTTVKVRNFDNTITTFPTYALIAQPFKNWSGMQRSGVRRIKRDLLIDVSSIRYCDEKLLEKLSAMPLLTDYIANKRIEIAEDETQSRRLTNIGTFRAYVDAYLRNHPNICTELPLIVRQLDPSAQGLPIQLYCFVDTTEWGTFEGIQSDIFDHLFAITREFDLKFFQDPTGTDFTSALG